MVKAVDVDVYSMSSDSIQGGAIDILYQLSSASSSSDIKILGVVDGKSFGSACSAVVNLTNENSNKKWYFREEIYLRSDTGECFSFKGNNVRIELQNFLTNLTVVDKDSEAVVYDGRMDFDNILRFGFKVYDKEGKGYEITSNIDLDVSYDDNLDLVINLENCKYDIYSLGFYFYWYLPDVYYVDASYLDLNLYDFKRTFGLSPANIYIDESEYKENYSGILTTIIDWLTSIRDNILNVFDTLKQGFSAIVTVITELPERIWDYIEIGLKNLFVPSEDDIVAIQDDWDTLLRDRFGALYQAVDMITDYADAFVEQEKSTITFPSVSIPLAGSNFVFGGWEVKVIPDGFGFLVDALKMVISIVCTFAVVNMLRNRFERILTGGMDV